MESARKREKKFKKKHLKYNKNYLMSVQENIYTKNTSIKHIQSMFDNNFRKCF